MNIGEAVILGIVQGLAEFLPVSSSGHLVLIQSILPNFVQPGVLFDTILHAGTSLAIIYYFRNELKIIFKQYLLPLIVGSIPAAFVGVLFQSFLEGLFLSVKMVGGALILTAFINYLTDRCEGRREKVGIVDAFLVGIAQAIAIVPGISRSGATISTATGLGIRKSDAAKFSFILSIPAVWGANFVEFMSHNINNGQVDILVYFAGFVLAFISGLLAISLVLRMLSERRFRIFSLYCLLVGFMILVLL